MMPNPALKARLDEDAGQWSEGPGRRICVVDFSYEKQKNQAKECRH
jgi:hypothetical protein